MKKFIFLVGLQTAIVCSPLYALNTDEFESEVVKNFTPSTLCVSENNFELYWKSKKDTLTISNKEDEEKQRNEFEKKVLESFSNAVSNEKKTNKERAILAYFIYDYFGYRNAEAIKNEREKQTPNQESIKTLTSKFTQTLDNLMVYVRYTKTQNWTENRIERSLWSFIEQSQYPLTLNYVPQLLENGYAKAVTSLDRKSLSLSEKVEIAALLWKHKSLSRYLTFMRFLAPSVTEKSNTLTKESKTLLESIPQLAGIISAYGRLESHISVPYDSTTLFTWKNKTIQKSSNEKEEQTVEENTKEDLPKNSFKFKEKHYFTLEGDTKSIIDSLTLLTEQSTLKTIQGSSDTYTKILKDIQNDLDKLPRESLRKPLLSAKKQETPENSSSTLKKEKEECEQIIAALKELADVVNPSRIEGMLRVIYKKVYDSLPTTL